MRRFRSPRQPPFNDSDDTNPSSSEPAQDTAADTFYPGLFDVFKVRHILRWKIISEGLPMEILDMIMEAAEYWPSIEARMDTRTIIRQDHDRELLRTAPLCYDEAVCSRACLDCGWRLSSLQFLRFLDLLWRLIAYDLSIGNGKRIPRFTSSSDHTSLSQDCFHNLVP
jgi:hypothetical protein